MDRHATHQTALAASSRARRARWLAITGGLLLTIIVSLVYMQVLFESGFAPVQFVVVAYLCGAAVAFIAQLILPSRLVFMMALGLIVIVLAAIAVDGDSRVLFWLALLPSIGAVAVTVPIGRAA